MTIRELITHLLREYDDLDYEVLVSVAGNEYPIEVVSFIMSGPGGNGLVVKPEH